jgi:hypothetical protein
LPTSFCVSLHARLPASALLLYYPVTHDPLSHAPYPLRAYGRFLPLLSLLLEERLVHSALHVRVVSLRQQPLQQSQTLCLRDSMRTDRRHDTLE